MIYHLSLSLIRITTQLFGLRFIFFEYTICITKQLEHLLGQPLYSALHIQSWSEILHTPVSSTRRILLHEMLCNETSHPLSLASLCKCMDQPAQTTEKIGIQFSLLCLIFACKV